jgi:parvulin-like peptidyl-prolyl isomerase
VWSVFLLSAIALVHQQEAVAAPVTDRIVAVVNTELIMLSELKDEIAGEEKRVQEHYQGADLQRRLRLVAFMGLTRMIERKLQIQLAKSRGVEITDDEVSRAIRELQRQGEPIDENNPDERKSIKDQLTLMRVVDREVRSGVMVSEVEMRRYYERHQNRFTLPEEYRLSQILILPKNGQSHAETRTRAEGILAQLKQGADFADLVLKYSDGPEATRGGNLGFVRQGELLPSIERAVAELQPRGISEVVETSEGFHIIRLDEKKPLQFRPFEEIKAEIQGLVYQQKSEDIYQVWLAELKNKAFIEVKF